MPALLPSLFTESRCQKHSYWLLLLLTAFLYLPGLGHLPMMDRDEPRFAHATVEMMQRDTWTVPYFNGEYRFDKPPLTYWWMRLHYNVFGATEFAARLHSVFATWLVGCVIVAIGRRLASARAGLFAGLAWLLTLQVFVHGRLCVADMPMVLCVALAMRAVIEIQLRPLPGFNRWHWLLYIALGLGFLAKGPIAWLVPALALVLHRFAFWRKPYPWRNLRLAQGALVALAITGAWGIPALLQTHGLFWQVGMGEPVVARGTSAFNGRFPVPGYYLATALASLFPWIICLPQVWKNVRQQWSPELSLLVSWLAAPYLIFTLYATQLAHYVMPGFPAAVLLMSVCTEEARPRWQAGWAGFVVGLFVLISGAAFYGAGMSALPGALKPMLIDGGLLVGLFAILGMAVALPISCVRWRAIVAGTAILVMPWPLTRLIGDVRSIHPALKIAQSVGPLPKDAELLGWQFTEPSLVFHFDHEWKFTSKLETAIKNLDRKRPNVTVLLRREWTLDRALRDGMPARDFSAEVDPVIASHPGHQVLRVDGFNAARSSWAEIVVLTRTSPGPQVK